MKMTFPDNDVQLVPDIVLSISGEGSADFASRQGILLCMRNDVEQVLGNDSHRLFEELARDLGMDWRVSVWSMGSGTSSVPPVSLSPTDCMA